MCDEGIKRREKERKKVGKGGRYRGAGMWQARSEEGARESTKREGANGSQSLHNKRTPNIPKGKEDAPGATSKTNTVGSIGAIRTMGQKGIHVHSTGRKSRSTSYRKIFLPREQTLSIW